MNINSIQTSQLSQNAIRANDRAGYTVDTSVGSSSAEVTSVMKTPQASTQGGTVGTDYIKEQLQELLMSFPPWFPAGSPQRIALIKKVKGLEDQISNSSLNDNLKKAFSETKLPEQPSNDEISSALVRLFGLGDALKQKSPASADSAKQGTILNVKV